MRTVSTLLVLLLAVPAFGSALSDAQAALALAMADDTPAAKTITLMVGCEGGKCTPVTVPAGSLVTSSGGIIVPLRVENGVTIYRDHETYRGGSCQGGNCSGPASCGASGVCSSCTKCTATSPATIRSFRTVQAGNCPTCPMGK